MRSCGALNGSSQQQANGLDQVNVAINHMDESTQQNAAMAEETSAVAASMSEQAKKLTDLITVFKIREDGHRPYIAPTPTPVPVPAPVQPRVASVAPVKAAPSPLPLMRASGGNAVWQEF